MTDDTRRTASGVHPDGEAQASPDAPHLDQELLPQLQRLRDEFTGFVRDSTRLMKAESRLFVSSLLLIVMLIAVLAIAATTVLGLIAAGGVLLLVQHAGFGWVSAVFCIAAFFVLLVAAAGLWIKALTRHLGFVETRRMMGFSANQESKNNSGEQA